MESEPCCLDDQTSYHLVTSLMALGPYPYSEHLGDPSHMKDKATSSDKTSSV